MFSKKIYRNPPLGWSRRELTYWDSCYFARNDSPTIGWVLEGTDVDKENMSSALERAIQRRAPWLNGRLARTESGSPPFEVHVPPENSSIPAFNVTVSEVSDDLNSVVSWVRNGTPTGATEPLPAYDPKFLNPRTKVSGVEEYISGDLPLLHLHFIEARDATLMSLSWSHIVMDALACGQIVTAWEQELVSPKSSIQYADSDPSTVFDFTEKVTLEEGWRPSGWLRINNWQMLKVGVPYFYERYNYPLIHGSVFIPSAIIARWISAASAELPKGQWVSRNDLVTAWVFKYAWGGTYFKDEHWNTVFTAICFRGRHPALPKELIMNTAKSNVVPSLTTLELRTWSLARVALRIRRSLDIYEDLKYVENAVTHEIRDMKKGNGSTREMPLHRIDARPFGSTSWAKIGVCSPKFGSQETIACLTYNAGRGCATIYDSSEGDWRVDYMFSARAWQALSEQMEKENQALKAAV